jgi:dethiobiotin synthetase
VTQGIFVTGTNTGVGKTVIAAALLRLAGRHGVRAVGLKPLASGSETDADGHLRNADALELQAASAHALSYELVNPYCFEPAIAPHIAAREVSRPVLLQDLQGWYQRASEASDLAIVEGAGGWRVPLHPSGFLSDLPEALRMPVVLVVGLTLGCLNHARLTAEIITAGGRCPLAGWVANEVDPGFERPDENVETLAQLLGGPPLARVRRVVGGPWSTHGNPTIDLPDEPSLLAALGLHPAGRGLYTDG